MDHENKTIYLNKEYKNWRNLIDLHSKAESGSIQAMEELEKEMINIINEGKTIDTCCLVFYLYFMSIIHLK